MDKPRFQHDCDKCVFLGPFKEFDLYYCDKWNHRTVIARFSDEPSEYHSGLGFTHMPELVEAEKRAKMLELNCVR